MAKKNTEYDYTPYTPPEEAEEKPVEKPVEKPKPAPKAEGTSAWGW